MAVATAAPVILFDGNDVPTAEGWDRRSNGGTESANSGLARFVSSGPESPGGGAFNGYVYDTGATDFVVSIRLRVDTSSFNQFDGGLVFSALGMPFGLMAAERDNGLMIGATGVLWGDESDVTVTVDTSVFHEYAFRYLAGNLEVYLDAAFDSIVDGTASPILSRAAVLPPFGNPAGLIAFGDNSNEAGVGSDYTVDYVKFQDLTPVSSVPEPATLTLIGAAVALVVRRRLGASRV